MPSDLSRLAFSFAIARTGFLMIQPKAIPSAAIRVTIFWSLIFAFIYWDYFDRTKTIFGLIVISASVFFGILLTAVIIHIDRREIIRSIKGKTIRGMLCNIGAIPIHSPPLLESANFPQKSFYPSEIADADLLQKWRETMPIPLGELLDCILKTLWASKETPASPLLKLLDGVWVSNAGRNHGGRSLVTHSILVANLMCEQARFYKYEVPKHDDIPLFEALDPNFQLDPRDPLIPIIGLAHDIGKIECMVWEDGKPNKMDHGHDYIGARIVARMDAFWNEGIDAESRRILQAVLAHYHHVHELPMDKSGKPTSDRLHALMELLIKCDKAASAIENCASTEKIDVVKQKAFQSNSDLGAMYEKIKPDTDDLLSVIHMVLLGAGRINVREDKGSLTSIGWKYFLPQYNRTIILLKEDVFIQAVADLMGIEITPEARTGGANPVMHLTQEVLKVLNVADILFSTFDDFDRSPVTQLYRADFYKPHDYFLDKECITPKEGFELEKIKPLKRFSMESTIALHIDNYPILQKLKDMSDYACVFNIGKARLGNQGVRSINKQKINQEPKNFPIITDDCLDSVKMEIANNVPKLIPAWRLKNLIEREIIKKEKCQIEVIESVSTQGKTLLLHNFDKWLLAEAKMTFEQIQQQEPQWFDLAGIIEVKISSKGTKLIRVNFIT